MTTGSQKKLGDENTAFKLTRELEALTLLSRCAALEGGFSPGLLGCFRARAAAVVAEVLELSLVGRGPEAELTPALKTAAPQPPEKSEPSNVVAFPTVEPNKRAKARRYSRTSELVVHHALDLWSQGKSDLAVAKETGLSPNMVYRIRTRCPSFDYLHQHIDSWRAKQKAGSK